MDVSATKYGLFANSKWCSQASNRLISPTKNGDLQSMRQTVTCYCNFGVSNHSSNNGKGSITNTAGLLFSMCSLGWKSAQTRLGGQPRQRGREVNINRYQWGDEHCGRSLNMDRYGQPTQASCTGMCQHANCKENLLAREMCFCWFFRLSSHGGERAKTCGSRHLRGYFLAVGGKKTCQKSFFLGLFLQAQRKWLTGVLSCATSGFAILIQYSSCSQYRFSNNCWDDTDELHCSGSASQTIPTIIHPQKKPFQGLESCFFSVLGSQNVLCRLK